MLASEASRADISHKLLHGYDLLPQRIRQAYAHGPLDVSALNAVAAWKERRRQGWTQEQFAQLIADKFEAKLRDIPAWPGDYPSDIPPLKG